MLLDLTTLVYPLSFSNFLYLPILLSLSVFVLFIPLHPFSFPSHSSPIFLSFILSSFSSHLVFSVFSFSIHRSPIALSIVLYLFSSFSFPIFSSSPLLSACAPECALQHRFSSRSARRHFYLLSIYPIYRWKRCPPLSGIDGPLRSFSDS